MAQELKVSPAVLFVICAFAYLVAFALNHLCAPRFDEIPASEFNR
jgi:hypothetical protein